MTLNEARGEAGRLADKWQMDAHVKRNPDGSYRATIFGADYDADTVEAVKPTTGYHTCRTCRPDLYPRR